MEKSCAVWRQNIRYACHIFSTREEEAMLLGEVPTISYLRLEDLLAFYELIMGCPPVKRKT
jgi:hypothetical protein